MKQEDIDQLVAKVARRFASFGKFSRVDEFNPLSIMLKDGKPLFAAGVSVEKVVQFIIEELKGK